MKITELLLAELDREAVGYPQDAGTSPGRKERLEAAREVDAAWLSGDDRCHHSRLGSTWW